jgi:hypothetical protein
MRVDDPINVDLASKFRLANHGGVCKVCAPTRFPFRRAIAFLAFSPDDSHIKISTSINYTKNKDKNTSAEAGSILENLATSEKFSRSLKDLVYAINIISRLGMMWKYSKE